MLVLVLLLSNLTFAGDLSVVCYLNGDKGDSLETSDIFMEKNNISMQFYHRESLYTVLVSRKSFFANYKYEIIKVNKTDMSFIKILRNAKKYDDEVSVDAEVSCIITD